MIAFESRTYPGARLMQSPLSTSLALVFLAAHGISKTMADGPGVGLSKTTYSANTPLVGLELHAALVHLVVYAVDRAGAHVAGAAVHRVRHGEIPAREPTGQRDEEGD